MSYDSLRHFADSWVLLGMLLVSDGRVMVVGGLVNYSGVPEFYR